MPPDRARRRNDGPIIYPMSSPRKRGPIARFISVLEYGCNQSRAHGVWVPAFAGTTAETHHSAAVALSIAPIPGRSHTCGITSSANSVMLRTVRW